MKNRDIEAAKEFHESTKLSYINLSNKPPLYKSYDGVPVIPLPSGFDRPSAPTLEAVAGHLSQSRAGPEHLDLTAAAQLLYYSAGLIQKRILPLAGEVHYRAAASAGALFPVEVYLVSSDIPSLEAGVYHFSPADFALRQLRKGDYRSELLRATAGDEAVAAAPITLVFAAMFWRSSWKYRVRGYRYCFWDAGTMLANLLATANSGTGLSARLVAGFVDRRVNELLGVQPEQEASICLVALGTGASIPTSPDLSEVGPIDVQTDEGLDGEISYPEIVRSHAASSLESDDEVLAWRGGGGSGSGLESAVQENPQTPCGGSQIDLQGLRTEPLGETISRRGSTRRFARVPISAAQFRAILDGSTKKVPADFTQGDAGSLLDAYIIVNAVEGLRPGTYYFSLSDRNLELLKPGDFREEAGHLCFEQALGADSAAVVFLMADLDRVLERYGNRGYRAAQLEAGIMVGNAYLCAHSLGLGATGMTFYDDDVIDFFAPHSEGKSLMFLVAVGVTDERNRVRPFRSRVGVVLDSLARGAGGSPPGTKPA